MTEEQATDPTLPEAEALHRVPDAYGGATDPATLLELARGGTVGVLHVTLVRQGASGQPHCLCATTSTPSASGTPERCGATSSCAAMSGAW